MTTLFQNSMPTVGSSLLFNVNELIKTMDEMKTKKDLLKTQILEEEDEKIKIENELSILTERLEKTNGIRIKWFTNVYFCIEVIKKLTIEFQDIEKTIFDTENARAKVIFFGK